MRKWGACSGMTRGVWRQRFCACASCWVLCAFPPSPMLRSASWQHLGQACVCVCATPAETFRLARRASRSCACVRAFALPRHPSTQGGLRACQISDALPCSVALRGHRLAVGLRRRRRCSCCRGGRAPKVTAPPPPGIDEIRSGHTAASARYFGIYFVPRRPRSAPTAIPMLSACLAGKPRGAFCSAAHMPCTLARVCLHALSQVHEVDLATCVKWVRSWTSGEQSSTMCGPCYAGGASLPGPFSSSWPAGRGPLPPPIRGNIVPRLLPPSWRWTGSRGWEARGDMVLLLVEVQVVGWGGFVMFAPPHVVVRPCGRERLCSYIPAPGSSWSSGLRLFGVCPNSIRAGPCL